MSNLKEIVVLQKDLKTNKVLQKNIFVDGNIDSPNEPIVKYELETHNNLSKDLLDLFFEANANEFDDFKNTKYDSPKNELVSKLLKIIQDTKNGKYDETN